MNKRLAFPILSAYSSSARLSDKNKGDLINCDKKSQSS